MAGLSVLQKVLDTAAERSWLVTSVNVETMTDVAFLKVFQDLDKRKEGQIIIDCETERLTGILKEVGRRFVVVVVVVVMMMMRLFLQKARQRVSMTHRSGSFVKIPIHNKVPICRAANDK